jgi:hypothetical protein
MVISDHKLLLDDTQLFIFVFYHQFLLLNTNHEFVDNLYVKLQHVVLIWLYTRVRGLRQCLRSDVRRLLRSVPRAADADIHAASLPECLLEFLRERSRT